MQAILTVQCGQCDRMLGRLQIDTADDSELVKKRLDDVILQHRAECLFYGGHNKAKYSFGGMRL